MTYTPDHARRARLALGLCGAALVLAPPGLAASGGKAAASIAKAEAALARSDGIAAEIELKQALGKGVRRDAVAALMGEALLDQGEPNRARGWLEPGQFTRGTALRGFRALARLKRLDGDLASAGKALDQAIAAAPNDPELWVEVASLRYAGGEHLQAVDAAEHAVKLGPKSVPALVFNGMLVRDRHGLAAGLPWFEAALALAPDDLAALGEYAATLGDIGRNREMLVVTRRMLEIDEGNPRAFYLQAVMAARAGNVGLARKLVAKTGGRLGSTPAVQLLRGALELDAGNTVMAIDVLTTLSLRQPGNRRAQALLARALYLGGEHRALLQRFGGEAERTDASPYVLTVLARAHEAAGRRDLAAPLLDRAARDYARPMAALASGSEVGALLSSGNVASAAAASAAELAAAPGNADRLARAGDVALVRGNGAQAADLYRQAARVRLSEPLLLRLSVALELAGRGGEAADLVEGYLARSPSSQVAIRLAAATARQRGRHERSAALLGALSRNGGQRDARLLADLAWARIRAGDQGAGAEAATEAYRLQRASPFAAQALGMALGRSADGAALMAKARTMNADLSTLPSVRYAFR